MDDNGVAPDCLSGVRVLDLSQFEAGPSCTEVLAMLGAEVVKVESPKGGEPGRAIGTGPHRAPTATTSWSTTPTRSRSRSTSRPPRGIALVKEMAEHADVFVENMAPGTIERLGLGWDVLHALNPRLIYAQVKGFGEGSPYEHNLAFDMIAQASGGMMSITGERAGRPCKPGPTLGDTGTGMLLAISILSTLYQRQTTGKGRRIQIAMQDAMLQYIRGALAQHARTGEPAMRNGAKPLAGGISPVGIYPCAPGGPNDYVYLFTSNTNPEHWRRLLKVLGREDLLDDPRFADPREARRARGRVDALITEWTRRHDKHEAMRLVGAAGVPAGAVLDTGDLLGEPSFETRGIMQTMQHPRGPLKMPTFPVRFDGAPPRVTPAPLLGEHNTTVLVDWLGMSANDVEALKRDRVL